MGILAEVAHISLELDLLLALEQVAVGDDASDEEDGLVREVG